jgi:pimeloyl-ACP methyl ester carboxylesterase
MLGEAVRKRSLLSWEEAVHHITEVPAKLYGIKDRGRLAEGYWADICVIDPQKVGARPTYARYDLPGGAWRLYGEADGIDHVLVNGTEIVDHGTFTDARRVAPLRARHGRHRGLLTMPRREVNGVELWYEDTGGSGPAILFHHGYTGSHDSWPPIVDLLRDRYRCVMMDSRGAGDSAHPESGYTIAQYAADVVGLCDALGIDRFTFVGHSMGGGVGFWLGLEHAQRLERLVLVAPVPSGGVKMPPAMRRAASKLWYDRNADELVRQRLAGAARPELNDEVVAKSRVDRALSVSTGHYEESWAAIESFDVTDRLGDLKTPTLMIAGAADALARDNVTDYLRLPNASLHVFNRVGHFVPTDVPDEFAGVLADFMDNGVVTARTLYERMTAH